MSTLPCFPRRWVRVWGLLSCLVLGGAWPAVSRASGAPGIDGLMGGRGRENIARRLESFGAAGGKSYSWSDFSGWGREIFREGSVAAPPEGEAPSDKVSRHYKCVTCHNDVREDPDLLEQDPEARFELTVRGRRDVFLLQGATMWGIVNRTSFYGDYFSKYHDLCVPGETGGRSLPCGLLGLCFPGCRTMDPSSLEDAIQVCSNYCSVGRFLREWELLSLLAYFWDLEIRLDDLALTPSQRSDLDALAASSDDDLQKTSKVRRLLAAAYPAKAANTYRGVPEVNAREGGGAVAARYDDGLTFTGDPDRGKRLYGVSCGRCHGSENMPEIAGDLGGDPTDFYELIADGSPRWFWSYMPSFSLERLSRRQAADILAYLSTLLPHRQK